MTLFAFLTRRAALGSLAAATCLAPLPAQPAPAPTLLSAMTVTGTREKAPLSETPASIGALQSDVIRETAPLHPAQLLGQVPGVAIAVTNGEGHTTAIRQPFTTSPVYLFLEDGIPIRATGFFNHNALYEVNLAGAGGVEIVRGPGTALYGSDAIGGIVNVLSRAPTSDPHAALSAEHGAFGTWRLLGSGGGALHGRADFQFDVNLTHTEGWREHTGYDRRSANLRIDHRLGRDTTLKAIVGVSRIEQETGANSPLTSDDYAQHPTRNLMPIAYRKVSAVRASLEYERQFDRGMISILPYFRRNAMELNGTFNLSFDPRIEETGNSSFGLLAKVRKNLPVLRARLIGGFDLDYSPGSRREDNLLVARSGSGANTRYLGSTRGTRIYDYEVTFRSASPYLHAELSPLAALRVTAGLRYDALRYTMANRLPAGVVAASVHGATRFYGQVDGARAQFSRLSPKLGATYALTPRLHLYASHNYGFRAPSEGQLFRAGNDALAASALTRAQLALGLAPIKAVQTEAGLRGHRGGWSWNLVAYDLAKRDDLVAQRDLATNVATSVNAGRTSHRGLELGLGIQLIESLRLDSALSHARHVYEDWRTATANLSGREIEAAPRALANTRLSWRPRATTLLQLEWVRIGAYWLEASNSAAFGKYPGHNLLNLRASHAVTRRVGLFARVMNLADRRFADSASVSSNTRVFSPGLPRAIYGGVEVSW